MQHRPVEDCHSKGKGMHLARQQRTQCIQRRRISLEGLPCASPASHAGASLDGVDGVAPLAEQVLDVVEQHCSSEVVSAGGCGKGDKVEGSCLTHQGVVPAVLLHLHSARRGTSTYIPSPTALGSAAPEAAAIHSPASVSPGSMPHCGRWSGGHSGSIHSMAFK